MLTKKILALFTMFIMVMACSKKDKNDDPPVNADIKAIQDYLSQTNGVRDFGRSFEEVIFTDEDINSGFTIFAPADSAIKNYDPNARVEEVGPILTANEVKDHIVKGQIKTADLTHGKKLIALSGKELVVTIDGDKIMINGVVILSNTSGTSKAIIYTISNVLCKKPGAAEITIFDGTQWSTTDTLGKTVANANVALYYSYNDIANNAQPAATGKTTANGKITFPGLPAGTYYMIVNKDDKSNFIQPVMQGGYLIGYKPVGILQNMSQQNMFPYLPASEPGDFIYQDTNGDGKIDANDRTYIPAEVVVNSNKTVQVTSLIGYLYNHVGARFTGKEDAQAFLDKAYTAIGNWHHYQVATDAVLSDEAGCGSLFTMCDLDEFKITPVNSHLISFWYPAYEYITRLNRLILNVPALNLPAAEANNLIAQAKGLRGFVYLQLATYYGELPLKTSITGVELLPRSSLAETYTFIKNDLTEAMALLPGRFTGADHRRISADACKLLLARIAMAQGDYVKAKQLSSELMQSNTYSLVAVNNIFVSDENAETIWNINPGIYASYASIINEGGTKSFCPAVRYAEVLLINSEARINLGELDANNINQVLTRRGQPTVTFTDNSQARDIVQSTWKMELYREGQRFAKLVKWNMALPVLAAKGFKEFNKLMPIPQPLLDMSPNMYQNPGY